ncbi:hypothetical protein N7456_009551 [Penicillium angulare]|uniref:Uncharacterized protein n=1 Tax=Penicillium angulare TaxID=116970 RepID=A0A9W9K5N9_9EURO|nr:hypothetical protein N7456_009551 [Penicillium angulare]
MNHTLARFSPEYLESISLLLSSIGTFAFSVFQVIFRKISRHWSPDDSLPTAVNQDTESGPQISTESPFPASNGMISTLRALFRGDFQLRSTRKSYVTGDKTDLEGGTLRFYGTTAPSQPSNRDISYILKVLIDELSLFLSVLGTDFDYPEPDLESCSEISGLPRWNLAPSQIRRPLRRRPPCR